MIYLRKISSKTVFPQFFKSSKISTRKKITWKSKIGNAQNFWQKLKIITGNYRELDVSHFHIIEACNSSFYLSSFSHSSISFCKLLKKYLLELERNKKTKPFFRLNFTHFLLTKVCILVNIFEHFLLSKWSKKSSKIFTQIQTFVIRKCEFGPFVWNWALKNKSWRLLAKLPRSIFVIFSNFSSSMHMYVKIWKLAPDDRLGSSSIVDG